MSEPYILSINDTDKNRCNCVFWTRDRVPNLPFGLWTINDKKKIINTKKSKVGRVAIMSAGWPWGHVSIVTKVGKNHITIREANFRRCKITERHDTPENLKVLGYFNTNK